MKRIAIVAVMVLMSLAATARSVHYFTFSQASRTVSYLNAQNEMMIHCGYDYEIPTYVLVNEVWMERVNSAYYEIWVYGYDAYTGDEIYMPIDLQCVWLYSGNRMYNAAQYLRFHVSVVQPSFTWHIPAYNHYVRVGHRPGYARTYHYHIHRHGWTPPAYTYGPGAPPPPLPSMPAGAWTPGVNRPTVPTPATTSTRDNNPTTGRQVQSSHSTGSSSSTNRATNRGSATTPATTRSSSGTATSRSSSGTATSRSSSGTATSRTSAATTPTRSTATSRGGGNTTGDSRSEATRSNTAPTRSAVNSSRSSASSSRSTTATPATSRSSATRSAATRSSATESNAKSSTGTVSGSRGTRTTTR